MPSSHASHPRPSVAGLIGSDLRGLDKFTTRLDALLAPPDDPDALAAAIRRVLDHDDLAERLGSAARETAAPFHWERRAEAVLAFVAETAGAVRSG